MKQQNPRPDGRRQQIIEAVALFSVLMHARDVGELQEAADAQGKLTSLGVVVEFRRPRIRWKGCRDA